MLPPFDERSSSWSRTSVWSLRTHSSSNCTLAMSSHNAKAVIMSRGTAITHRYSPDIVPDTPEGNVTPQ